MSIKTLFTVVQSRLSVAFLLISLCFSSTAFADEPKLNPITERFLKRSEGERSWWYTGAFNVLGHLVYQSDKEKAQCIWDWYSRDPEKQQKIIESTMKKFPDHYPAGIILALTYKACGKFKVQ